MNGMQATQLNDSIWHSWVSQSLIPYRLLGLKSGSIDDLSHEDSVYAPCASGTPESGPQKLKG